MSTELESAETPSTPDSAVVESTLPASTEEASSPAEAAGDEEGPVTIKRYAAEIATLQSYEDRVMEACVEASMPIMLIFWGLAGALGWHGWLGGLGVAVVLLIAIAAVCVLGSIAMRAIAGDLLGMVLNTGLTYGALGFYLSSEYDPSYAGWALAAVSAVVHTVRFTQIGRQRELELKERHVSTRLRAELTELPEVLRPEVREILDRVARDRQETCSVLRTSLAEDASINRFALLSGMDDAFSCLLNRAGAVNGLLDRVIDDPDDPITRSAREAFARFKETANGIHDVAVTLLAYAASRSEQATETLAEQVEDLAQMSAAWQELGSL